MTCGVAFVHDDPAYPDLTCDKSSRPHVVHRDPASGIRYQRSWRGAWCWCTWRLWRHADHCPLRTREEVAA